MVCTLLGYISDIKLSRLIFIATSLPPPPKKNFTGFTFNPKKVDIQGDSFRSLWDQEHFLGLCRKPLCIMQELGYQHILTNLGSFIHIKNVTNACALLISLLSCRLNLCTVSLHREMAEWSKHSNPAASLKNFIFFLVCLQSHFLILLQFVLRTIMPQSYTTTTFSLHLPSMLESSLKSCSFPPPCQWTCMEPILAVHCEA